MVDIGLTNLVKLNAETVISALSPTFNVVMGYNDASVQWLAVYIESLRRDTLTPYNRKTMIDTLGSYLGECIRHQYGGEWGDVGENIALKFPNGSAAFPMIAVTRHMDNGSSDSVTNFYRSIPKLIG